MDQPKPQRRSIRLSGYDYSDEGAYFVTICTKDGEFLFGEIRDGAVALSKIGQMVRDYWSEIPKHFENVQLDEFVIMPNHLHGIIIIEKRVQYIEPSSGIDPALNKYQHVTPKSIGSIIRSFKAAVTRWCRENSLEGRIWQRNYYEHIIRSEKSLNKIRQLYPIRMPKGLTKNSGANWPNGR